MSADWDLDDMARLLALEHAFCAVALLTASNYASLSGTTPTAAVKQLRDAIESSVFDHIAQMAVLVEKGPQS